MTARGYRVGRTHVGDHVRRHAGECVRGVCEPRATGVDDRPWLTGERGSQSAILCGRNAVQLSPPAGAKLSLDELADKLSGVGRVTRNPFLLRLAVDDYLLTVFPDGRAIVGGTDEIAEAKTIYARYIGS